MRDPETVIEAIQTDAASEVAQAATVATSEVAAEVAEVGATLEEHIETSEEQHTEILEGESWIRNQLEQLSQSSATLQATVLAMQAALLAAIAALQTTVTLTDTQPPTLETPVEIAVVEPVENVDDPPEAKTPEAKARPRRKII